MSYLTLRCNEQADKVDDPLKPSVEGPSPSERLEPGDILRRGDTVIVHW